MKTQRSGLIRKISSAHIEVDWC